MQLYTSVFVACSCMSLRVYQCNMNTIKIVESTEPNAICCLLVPNYLLDDWYSSRAMGVSYVTKLNQCIVGQVLLIKNMDSIETRVQVNACKISKKIQKASKRMKAVLKGKHCKLTVYQGEVEKPQELHDDWLYSIEDYR